MTPNSAMNRVGRSLLNACLGLASVLVAACGGGDRLASGGIVGTGISISSIGTITGIGSVTVNGVRFATTAAAVTIDGASVPETALRVGMVVTVQGQVFPDGTASAKLVDARTEVKGVVTGVDSAARAFTVLGQRLRTDQATVFAGGNFDTLLNQYVEVSGFRGTPGDVLATRVEIRPAVAPGTPLEVTGTVAAFDAVGRTFMIGAKLVDFSQVGSAFVPSGLGNGVVANVRGTMVGPGGRYFASEITIIATTVPGSENVKVEIEGIVTDFTSLASFRVNGQAIDGRSATLSGGTAAMLGSGAKVEVEGRLAQGVVIATTIEIERGAELALDAIVDSVDATGLVLGRQRFNVTGTTQYEDRSAAAMREFGLASIRVGDRLSVHGVRAATALVATRIVRLDATAPPESEPTSRAEGAISDFVSAANFTVTGRKVNASSARFEGGVAGDLRNGRRVEVEGVLAGDVLMATKVEFEAGDAASPSTGTVEGSVTDFVALSSFKVDGQPVDATQAQFENGAARDLVEGRRIRVTGTVDRGVLIASRIEFKSAPAGGKLEVEGAITDFVSPASFKVAGQSVDASTAIVSGGVVADLADGRKISAEGTFDGTVLRATKLEIKDPPEHTEAGVRGVITSFASAASFVVAGRTVNASGATFEHGTSAYLATGRVVDVEGVLSGDILVAEKVSFE